MTSGITSKAPTAKTGWDPNGPARRGWITPRAMRRGIALTTAAACITGCGLLFYGGLWLIAVGALCVAFAFLHGRPPTRWPTMAGATCWCWSSSDSSPSAVPVTFSAAAGHGRRASFRRPAGWRSTPLLTVNNYRDREQDARSGKRTLVVRLGARAGSRLYLALGFAAALLCLALFYDGRIGAALLPLLYLAPHTATWRRMVRIGRGRELNAILGATSRNILLFGILLSIGLLL